MDAEERKRILSRYGDHSRRFEQDAASRSRSHAENLPFGTPLPADARTPSEREIEVLQLIADGLINREIGERLFLSEETIKSHLRSLFAKLEARSRAHAVTIGFRRGLLT